MESKRNSRGTRLLSATVAGGYTLITGTALLAAWWAYKQRTIQLADLRAWFACCELTAQRRASGAKFRPGSGHVSCLVGAYDDRTVRSSLRRLVAVGLLGWSPTGFTIPTAHSLSNAAPDSRLQHKLEQVEYHWRRVPVPRRILLLLARATRPVLIATLLGHLLRCMFAKNGRVTGNGLCKASWVARAFGVDERNVKAARGELFAQGWLNADPASQKFLNLWGIPTRVNLAWGPADPEGRRSTARERNTAKSPPLPAVRGAESPPPLKNSNRMRRFENQKSAQPSDGLNEADATRVLPGLWHVQADDLSSLPRLRVRFNEAVRLGLVRPCPADELRFVAAAERARSLGTTNPPGFFATLVRRKLWHFIRQRDEDAAHAWLRRSVDGASRLVVGDVHQKQMQRRQSHCSRSLTRAATVVATLIARIADPP